MQSAPSLLSPSPPPPPPVYPAPPATLATHTCATPMPRAQVEVAGADVQAEVGAWVGCKGEGAPHPLPLGSRAVSLTLPTHRGRTASLLLPSPICWGWVLPTHLTLCRQRLPTSWVAHGLEHPRPPPLGSRAASPTLPRVARLVASPPHWKRGGSSAERTGAWGCTREAPAPSAGAKGKAREEGHVAQEEGMQTPVPLPSHSFYKGMGAEWCTHPPPLHGLLFAHYPEEGVSTTPCVVPRAQPLRTPPFECHPAHTHAMGEGRQREVVPPLCYPRVVHSPIEAHGVGQKGEGRGNPARRVCVAPPHAKGGWGICDAAPILMAPPILPYLCTKQGLLLCARPDRE